MKHLEKLRKITKKLKHLRKENSKQVLLIGFVMVGALVLGVLAGNLLKSYQKPSVQVVQQGEQSSANRSLVDGSLPEGLPIGPSEDASEEEKTAFGRSIRELGVDTDSINITDCNISPVVARVKLGNFVRFVNDSAEAHELSVFEEELTVSAYDSVSVEAGLPGIFGIACGSSLGYLEVIR